jgi:Tol biopolymer transport system component
MSDLGTQLRDYYDAAVTLIEPEDVIQQRVPYVAHPPTVRHRATQQPGWVVALSAAAVVLLVTAGVTWVAQRAPSNTPMVLVPVGPVPEQVIFHSAIFDEGTPGYVENHDLYAIDPDGSNLIQLTVTDANEGAASWAPDGSRIAFHSDDFDGDDTFSIYLMNPDGSEVVQLTEGVFPSWSPDGERIAFEKITDDRRSVWVINIDGTEEREVTSHAGYHSVPAWSPDGSRLVYASDPNASPGDCEFPAPEGSCSYDIYTIEVDGSNPTRLTDHPSQNGFPEWSPDGTRIAFHSDRDGNWDIYAMNPDGSDLTNLTNAPALDANPSWSPDGTQIVFTSNRDGAGELTHIMDADGSNPRLLTNMPGGSEALWPDW